MPRSRGGAGPARSAPSRPTAPAAPPRTAAPQQQQRPYSSTAAAPAQQQAAPPVAAQASQGPGLFGQMASTAAGVAVGSSIGHAIGGFFGGGSSSAPVEQQQAQAPTDAYSNTGNAMGGNALYSQSSANESSGPCAADIKSFTDCMNQKQGNMSICGWYMEQLKACQQAARQY